MVHVNTGVFGLCRLLGSHLDQILIVVDLIFSVPIFGQSVRLVFILCLSVCGSFGFLGYYFGHVGAGN